MYCIYVIGERHCQPSDFIRSKFWKQFSTAASTKFTVSRHVSPGKSNQNTDVHNFSFFFLSFPPPLEPLPLLIFSILRSTTTTTTTTNNARIQYFHRNTLFVAEENLTIETATTTATCPAPSVGGPVPFTRKIPGIHSKIHKRPKFRARSLSFNCFSQLAVSVTH